jgi:hypothetical protein
LLLFVWGIVHCVLSASSRRHSFGKNFFPRFAPP